MSPHRLASFSLGDLMVVSLASSLLCLLRNRHQVESQSLTLIMFILFSYHPFVGFNQELRDDDTGFLRRWGFVRQAILLSSSLLLLLFI